MSELALKTCLTRRASLRNFAIALGESVTFAFNLCCSCKTTHACDDDDDDDDNHGVANSHNKDGSNEKCGEQLVNVI